MESSASYIHPADEQRVLPEERLQELAARRWRRLLGLAVMAACWSMIVTGRLLSPHAGGWGTHQELGLPSCSFLARTGWPCPTCGMTTSVSAAAHGRFALAFRAQPFGLLLFAMAAGLGAAGLWQVFSRKNLLARGKLWLWLGAVCLIGLPAGWATKMLLGWMDGSLPWR